MHLCKKEQKQHETNRAAKFGHIELKKNEEPEGGLRPEGLGKEQVGTSKSLSVTMRHHHAMSYTNDPMCKEKLLNCFERQQPFLSQTFEPLATPQAIFLR